MFTVKFYNKFHWSESVSITNLSKEDCLNIQKMFEKNLVLHQNPTLEKRVGSQIKLANVSYIEYINEDAEFDKKPLNK